MKIVCFSKLVLVSLDDALNLRLEAFHRLGSDFVDSLGFPFLTPYFFAGHPSLFILFKLNVEPLFNHFLLLVEKSCLVLLISNKLLNFLLQILFVLE